MIRHLLLSVFLIGSGLAAVAQSAVGSAAFPAAWRGVWTGDLVIYNEKGLAQSVSMELHILPVDTIDGGWTWTLVYGEDQEAGRRPYLLRPVDPGKGVYAIDEGNSIVMENYLLGGKLYGRFEVEGTLLLATAELQGETLIYEIVAGGSDPAGITGGEKGIPVVKTFPVKTRQVAVLRR